jgi:hypothetical protein
MWFCNALVWSIPDGLSVVSSLKKILRVEFWLMCGYASIYPSVDNTASVSVVKKSKAVPLHAMEALGVRGGIASTHSYPRH